MDYSKFRFPEYVFREYPKMVDGVIVNSADEESAMLSLDPSPQIPDEARRVKRAYHRKES